MSITRILIIEDDCEDLEIVQELLREQSPRFRFHLQRAETLAEGLQLLQTAAFDVTLVDLSLPDAQGLDTVRQIHALSPLIPTIIFSGLDDEAIAIAALAEGAQDYIVKGKFDGELLLRTIRYGIERQRLIIQLEKQTQALQANERQLRTLIAQNADGVVVVDQNGTIQFVNPAAEEFFSRPAPELIGTVFGFPLVAGESAEIELVSRTGKMAIAEMRLVEISWEGKQAYLASLRDITLRKRAEKALKQLNESLETQVSERTLKLRQTSEQLVNEVIERQRSEELRRTVLANAPVVLWSISKEGTFILSEGKALQAIGFASQETVGQSVFEVYRDFPEVIASHHRALAGEEVQWRTEINRVVYECRATPVTDEEGTVVGAIGVATDITERVMAEQERDRLLERERAAREEAEKANRLKDEFLAILSHELRTPLNPILGWASFLRTGKLDQEQTARVFETIERNAQLLAQLIDDLLDISRILRGKLKLQTQTLQITSLVEAAVDTVSLAAQAKSIEIVTKYQPRLSLVLGDVDRLQQVIWNLLTNAVKFTPKGGRVEVCVRTIDQRVQIQVKDTGQGIDPDFLPYLFDKFRQENSSTTRNFGGLGLGLAIVRHLVELHGGTISASSPGKGQGATFTVELPVVKQTTANLKQSLPLPEVDLAGVRILVVDDQVDNLEVIVFGLESHDAKVTSVSQAKQALKIISTEKPDAIISDIGMPEIDGYELIRRIRSMPPETGGKIPAIAVSAYASEIDRQKAIAAGYDFHLAKPINTTLLAETIATLLPRKTG